MAARDHPTTMRENKSSTTARKSQLIACPNVGRIRHPFAVGLIGAEVAKAPIGSHLCSWLTSRSHGAMSWALREESLLSRQTSHPEAQHNEDPVRAARHAPVDSHTRRDSPEMLSSLVRRAAHLLGSAGWEPVCARQRIHSQKPRAPGTWSSSDTPADTLQ